MFRVRSYSAWRQGSKYKNKRTKTEHGTFQSKFEAKVGGDYEMMKKAGEIKGYECQSKVSLDVNGYHICNYYLDFKVEHNDGTIEWIEVKGFETPLWKLKAKLFEAIYIYAHPQEKYTIVRR